MFSGHEGRLFIVSTVGTETVQIQAAFAVDNETVGPGPELSHVALRFPLLLFSRLVSEIDL